MQGRTYKYMTDNIYFPFGFGLSYGRVGYDNLVVKADKKTGASVTVTLKNNGTKAVAETPQVYLSAPGAGVSAPLQQLVAFRRVQLEPGQSLDVTFDIPLERLKTVQEDGTRKLLKGEYTVTVASAAPCRRSVELGVSVLSSQVKL